MRKSSSVLRTNNRGYSNFCRKLSYTGFSRMHDLTVTHNRGLVSTSPYTSKLSYTKQCMAKQEISMNPWYILRELIRIEIGSTKRFIKLSDGEYLALLNAYYGGRTLVSAPKHTCKTTLLVIMAMMVRPKVVLYTAPLHAQDKFLAEFDETWTKFSKLLPSYLVSYFIKNKPHMAPISSVLDVYENESSINVPGFKTEDILILSEDIELRQPPLSYKYKNAINDARTVEGFTIPWLMVSSYNDEYYNGGDPTEPGSFDNSGRGLDLLYHVGIHDMPRFNSDRAKVKYYESQIKRFNIRDIFGTR